MTPRQQQYLAEYERLKHITITPGSYKTVQHIDVEVVEVDETTETALVRTSKSGAERVRTLHWCRKNLVKSS